MSEEITHLLSHNQNKIKLLSAKIDYIFCRF